jgi:reversibly glycosylated polypeptide/UDP-arabinopyranose mutase
MMVKTTENVGIKRRSLYYGTAFSLMIFTVYKLHDNINFSIDQGPTFISTSKQPISRFDMIPPRQNDIVDSNDVSDTDSQAANSAPGVTGPGIPALIKNILLETGVEITEESETSYAAEGAVNALEEKCKWIGEESNFEDKTCFDSIQFNKIREKFKADPSLIDIVTPSIRNLDFLNVWREFFEGFHVIIIQDGDPSVHLEIPDWVDYELYNRDDIKEALGDDQWIISSKDASIRNFGFLASKKPFIYTIDDDCLPATDNNGELVNPLEVHLQNLMSPANPYFFNTLYDPYSSGSDFVRGYPYSLRKGVKTAISHGLWMNTPDYDAPTQLLKPEERNENYIDMAMTIPYKILYPMCSMNVAFSRELIGPAFMQGLMGEGQPWARYDDMFAGWASKVVADHLGVGVKSGKPYIYHNKLSNPFVNLKKEYMGLEWQEDIIRFFANEATFSSDDDTPIKAYVQLARQIRTRFSELNPYFDRMAESMILWTHIWSQVEDGSIKLTPSRSSEGSKVWTSEHKREDLFGSLYPKKKIVTPKDIEVGHKWKTFLLPLDKQFHEDPFSDFVNDYAKKNRVTEYYTADEKKEFVFNQEVDYMAEGIILQKFLSSLNFVDDINDADLVLVPALPIAKASPRVRNDSAGMDQLDLEWFDELVEEIQKFSPKEPKKYLYLGTQDSSQNHFFIRDLMEDPNNIVLSLGPSGFVIPSLNTMKELQPKNYEGCIPMEKRSTFLFANQGIRSHLADRIAIKEELDSYNGTKAVQASEFISLALDMANSIFTICAPGDLPFQKRFFDAILMCTIPIVVSRENEEGEKVYWSNTRGKFANNQRMTSVEESFPKVDFSYSDIVVEVDGKVIDEGGMMDFLEKIPSEEINMKLKRFAEVRNRFVYDLDGTTEDAFSKILKEMEVIFGSSP